jgi:hypothetical protein
MRTADPAETAARQMGAFLQLKKMIEDMAGPRMYSRTNGLTPDEDRMRQDYNAAWYRIQQSKDEYKNLKALRGYDVSPQFRAEIIQTLFPPSFAAEYTRITGQALAQFQARHEARVNAENTVIKEAEAAAAERAANEKQNEQAFLDIKRCMSTGKSDAECASRAFGKAMNDIVGTVDPSLKATAPAGLMISGEYPGGNGVGVVFQSGENRTATLSCADLVLTSRPYTIKFNNNQLVVEVSNERDPILLRYTADEKLAGPGPTDVHGSVIAGYTQQWVAEYRYHDYVNRTDYVSPAHWTTVPILKPKTARCDVGLMTSNGKSAKVTQYDQNLAGAITGLFGTMNGREPGTVPPGLRLTGHYVSPGGLEVEFRPEKVVLDCGPSEAELPYVIHAAAVTIQNHIENNGKPVTLQYRPDGTLFGSGTIQLSAQSAPCQLGVVSPVSGTTGLPSLASANPGPAAGPSNQVAPARSTPGGGTITHGIAGNAVLSLRASVPMQPDAVNPLSGAPVFLMKDPFDTALKQGGVAMPLGSSVAKVVSDACGQGQKDSCERFLRAIANDTAAVANLDFEGKATFPGVAPGTYHLWNTTRLDNSAMTWQIKLDLKPGANLIVLDQSNGSTAK